MVRGRKAPAAINRENRIKRISPIFGIEYFRPPNPPREHWARDLRQIAALGFNTVRCWLYWRVVEPSPGRWDFAAYDRLFELAAKNRLRVLVTLITEAPPEWALKQLPDALLVRPDGTTEAIQHHSGMVSVGGYPGLCLDEPRAKGLAGRFLTETAKRYGRHPALAGFALQNEVMPFYSMSNVPVNHPCQHTLFRGFLRRRYRSLCRYNEVHLASLGSFAEARMRASGQPPDGLDRVAFCAERVIAQLAWRRDLVRAAAPAAALFCHAAGGVGAVTAVPWIQEEVAGLVDSWGTSQYESDVWMHLLSATITRATAGRKPWGIVEMTGGTMWTHYPSTARCPEEVVSLPWLFISLGATTNLFWQYRPERLGSESPNFGLVMETGRQPRRAQAVARMAQALRRHGFLLAGLRWPRPAIALVVDWHGFAYEEGLGAPQLHGIRIQELAGINAAFALAGFEVTALTSAHWEQHGLPPGIKLVVLPSNVVLTDRMLARLEQARRAGISVLAGPMIGHFTGDGWLRTQTKFARLEQLFGSTRCDVTTGDAIAITAEQGTFLGAQFCEEYELCGAEPWLRGAGGAVCGTRHRRGRSICWRYGGLVGKAFLSSPAASVSGGVVDSAAAGAAGVGGSSELPALLSAVATSAGIASAHPPHNHCLVRLGRKGRQQVLFVRNVTKAECQFRPEDRYRLKESLDGEAAPPARGEPLLLAPQQTRVFRLSA